jgi:hypothetical protein
MSWLACSSVSDGVLDLESSVLSERTIVQAKEQTPFR